MIQIKLLRKLKGKNLISSVSKLYKIQIISNKDLSNRIVRRFKENIFICQTAYINDE